MKEMSNQGLQGLHCRTEEAVPLIGENISHPGYPEVH